MASTGDTGYPYGTNGLPRRGVAPPGAAYTGAAAEYRTAVGAATATGTTIHPAMARAATTLVQEGALAGRVRALRHPLLSATEYDTSRYRIAPLAATVIGLAATTVAAWYTNLPTTVVVALAAVAVVWLVAHTARNHQGIAAAAAKHSRAVAVWDAHPPYLVYPNPAGNEAAQCAALVVRAYTLAAQHTAPPLTIPLQYMPWHVAHYLAGGEGAHATELTAAVAAYVAAYETLPPGVTPAPYAPTITSAHHLTGRYPIELVVGATHALGATPATT